MGKGMKLDYLTLCSIAAQEADGREDDLADKLH